MQKKYYTPEESDFHVEFEYEALEENKHSRNWHKKTYDRSSFLINVKHDSIEFIHEFRKDLLRVKYLDQTDIESLGWGFSKYCYKMIVKNTNHIAELRMLDNNTIHICKNLGTSEREFGKVDYDTLFEGTIKNKSELSKLMVQLGII